MRLRTLLITGFLFVSLLPLFVIGYFSVDSQAITQLSLTLTSESEQISLVRDDINTFLKTAESDVLFLSKLQHLDDLLNSVSSEEKAMHISHIVQDFISFSREKDIYYQIRYIDENGMEIVRVDDYENAPFSIPEGELQNKKGRYYFDDAMSARKGTVFVSPLDLNIERGELENRGTDTNPVYVPVIRYATPVFNKDDQPRGVIITNIYADKFIAEVDKLKFSGKISTLVNSDGYYLSHPNSNKEWGFMLGSNITLQNDYGEDILSESLGHLHEQIHEFKMFPMYSTPDISVADYGDYFLVHTHIWPSGSQSLSSTGANAAYSSSIKKVQGKDYYWTLMTIASKDYVFGPVIALKNRAFLIGLLTIFLVVLTSMIIAGRISKPLVELRDAALEIGQGKLRKIKIESKNEIGELADAFNMMASELEASQKQNKSYTKSLEKKVRERTSELNLGKEEAEEKALRLEKMKTATLNILEDMEEAKKELGKSNESLEAEIVERKKTEEEMKKAKMGLERSEQSIFITDKNTIIQYVNPAFERIYGYKASEVIGKTPKILKYGGVPRPHIKRLWNALSKKQSVTFAMLNKTKSGDPVNIKQSASPILDEHNELVGYMAIQSDVTEQAKAEKRLIESEIKFRTLFEGAGDAIFIVDVDRKRGLSMVDVNSKAEEAFGYTRMELLKMSPMTVSPPVQADGRSSAEKIMADMLKLLADGKPQFFEWVFLRSDGSQFTAEVNLSRVEIGGGYLAQAIVRDITERKKIDRAKNEFVSLASHQLRTPLTAIKWLIETVLKKGDLNKLQVDFLKDALKSNGRMIHLVSDLLNISRLEAGVIAVKSKKIDVSKFLQSLVKEAKISARSKGINIRFVKPKNKIVASLDGSLIGQVIMNLLSNATKYSPDKKDIVVSLKKHDKRINITVRDQGIGLSKEDQERLFAKFFRTQEASKIDTRGSGLGLYIVNKIATVCHGTIVCKSTKGKGSSFTVSLPLKGPVGKGAKELITKRIS